MTDTRSSTRDQLSVAGAELAPRSGLRVRRLRPVRALAGSLLVVASVVALVTLYTRIGDRREVLAVTRTVLAGEQITDADLKAVSISSDDSFPAVAARDRELLVGQYAKVRLVQDSLLVADSVQPEPLVDPERVLMSVPVELSGVPTGLREGSRLVLIVTPPSTGAGPAPATLVEATVAAVPRNLGELVGSDGTSTGSSTVALSIEVPPSAAAIVGQAEEVAVGVLDPSAPFPNQPTAPGAQPSKSAAGGSTGSIPEGDG
jgi:hypothetical protein